MEVEMSIQIPSKKKPQRRHFEGLFDTFKSMPKIRIELKTGRKDQSRSYLITWLSNATILRTDLNVIFYNQLRAEQWRCTVGRTHLKIIHFSLFVGLGRPSIYFLFIPIRSICTTLHPAIQTIVLFYNYWDIYYSSMNVTVGGTAKK